MDKQKIRAIAAQLPPVGKYSELDECVQVVAERHRLSIDELFERTTRPEICHPRQEVFWLARKAGQSHSKIARYFGMDHTTIMHGIRQVDARIENATEKKT